MAQEFDLSSIYGIAEPSSIGIGAEPRMLCFINAVFHHENTNIPNEIEILIHCSLENQDVYPSPKSCDLRCDQRYLFCLSPDII